MIVWLCLSGYDVLLTFLTYRTASDRWLGFKNQDKTWGNVQYHLTEQDKHRQTRWDIQTDLLITKNNWIHTGLSSCFTYIVINVSDKYCNLAETNILSDYQDLISLLCDNLLDGYHYETCIEQFHMALMVTEGELHYTRTLRNCYWLHSLNFWSPNVYVKLMIFVALG